MTDSNVADSKHNDTDSGRYRPGAGIMLVNGNGHVFVAQRLDNVVEAWQMPQGGIDDGEDPRAAALRELEEETGIAPHLVEIITQSRTELAYDLPMDLANTIWKGKWRGQRQWWFLMRFLGVDSDVNIDTAHPEFRDWKWVEPNALPDMIVPFKVALYQDILKEFQQFLIPQK